MVVTDNAPRHLQALSAGALSPICAANIIVLASKNDRANFALLDAMIYLHTAFHCSPVKSVSLSLNVLELLRSFNVLSLARPRNELFLSLISSMNALALFDSVSMAVLTGSKPLKTMSTTEAT